MFWVRCSVRVCIVEIGKSLFDTKCATVRGVCVCVCVCVCACACACACVCARVCVCMHLRIKISYNFHTSVVCSDVGNYN